MKQEMVQEVAGQSVSADRLQTAEALRRRAAVSIVKRLSNGNVNLQFGRYSTDEDLSRIRENLRYHQFAE